MLSFLSSIFILFIFQQDEGEWLDNLIGKHHNQFFSPSVLCPSLPCALPPYRFVQVQSQSEMLVPIKDILHLSRLKPSYPLPPLLMGWRDGRIKGWRDARKDGEIDRGLSSQSPRPNQHTSVCPEVRLDCLCCPPQGRRWSPIRSSLSSSS